MKDNKDFYPTPPHLIAKMVAKVENFHAVNTILEPSAGSGAIVEWLREHNRHGRRKDILAIEKDPRLQKTLREKNISLIDSDFLAHNGLEKYDLILANFPFSDGDRHLLKAIDLLFSGQIVCLINAQTIKNPHTNSRKLLARRLEELGAEIEYIQDAFLDPETERKTAVEVALVHIKKERSVEEELFDGMKEEETKEAERVDESGEIATRDRLANLVKGYQLEKEVLTRQIVEFYRNYHRISSYLELSVVGEERDWHQGDSLTEIMQSKLNKLSRRLKRDYWLRAFELEEVKKRLPSDKRKEVAAQLDTFGKMEFTRENIEAFILNLARSFPKMIDECIVGLFDKFTSYGVKDARWGAEFSSNVRYFNAWKSNSGYKVNRKVILPFYHSYGMDVNWEQAELLDDIDRVVAFFSPSRAKGGTGEICRQALREGQNRKIDTEFFLISIFKKGTIHLEFKDEQLLRWFNIEACKRKGWLPMDYSEKDFSELNREEKSLAGEFEDKKSSYRKIQSAGLAALPPGLALPAAKEESAA